MSKQNVVPLGDGQHQDYGYRSPNEHGVLIDFYTDRNTGIDAHAANIPNPPGVTFEPVVPYYIPYPIPVRLIPEIHKPNVPTPQEPIVTPEPGTMALMAGALIFGVAWRRYR
jgi:hypothetical protein